MLPSDFTTRSFGELKRLPSKCDASTVRRAVVLGARHAAPAMLAGDQPAFAVDGMAVGVHGRLAEDRDRAVGLVPAHHAVVGDVRPHQIAPGREPGRPLGPAAAGVELFEVHVADRRAGAKRASSTSKLELSSMAMYVPPVSYSRRLPLPAPVDQQHRDDHHAVGDLPSHLRDLHHRQDGLQQRDEHDADHGAEVGARPPRMCVPPSTTAAMAGSR